MTGTKTRAAKRTARKARDFLVVAIVLSVALTALSFSLAILWEVLLLVWAFSGQAVGYVFNIFYTGESTEQVSRVKFLLRAALFGDIVLAPVAVAIAYRRSYKKVKSEAQEEQEA